LTEENYPIAVLKSHDLLSIKVDKNAVTVSGLSSGGYEKKRRLSDCRYYVTLFQKADDFDVFVSFFDCSYMAVQYHVAFSGSVRGVGVIAAGPYWCTLSDKLNQVITQKRKFDQYQLYNNQPFNDLKIFVSGAQANLGIAQTACMTDVRPTL
jgi:hypothetical protein